MKKTFEFSLTAEELADAFCKLGDEAQAQFFIEVERLSRAWPTEHGGASYQWYLVGKHIRDCTCSNIEVQDMMKDMCSAFASDEEGK